MLFLFMQICEPIRSNGSSNEWKFTSWVAALIDKYKHIKNVIIQYIGTYTILQLIYIKLFLYAIKLETRMQL